MQHRDAGTVPRA